MTAPPTGTIEGVAEDGQGQPLPGVQLTLRAATGWIVTRATSRTDGSYRFADIAAGDYSISGAKGRYATATAVVAVRAGERPSAYLTLAAAAPGPAAAVPPAAAETARPTPSPAPALGPLELEELNVVAKRLEAARVAIEPQIGASTYTMTRQAIETQPGGANTTLNQVILQAPGVSPRQNDLPGRSATPPRSLRRVRLDRVRVYKASMIARTACAVSRTMTHREDEGRAAAGGRRRDRP